MNDTPTSVQPNKIETPLKKTADTETLEEFTAPKQRYGLGRMLSQGLGGTIGGPIFVIIGYALSVAGSGLLIALFLNGILMLGFIMIFSELALSLPIMGGGYSFSKEAIGGVQGFLIGWLIWIGNLLFIAISGIGFAYSLIVFLPDRWISPPVVKLIGFLIVVLFFTINLLYPKIASLLSRVLTFSIIIGFLTYIICGLIFGFQNNPDFSTHVFQEPFSFTGMMSMVAYTFVIYCVYEWNSTFESMTNLFDKIKRPRKTIPRAFIYSILIAIGIYWLVTFVTLLNIGSFESSTAGIVTSSNTPLADSFGIILNSSFGVYFMGFVGMLATITSINSGLQMSSHVLHSMARDGFMPSLFRKERNGVQWTALIISTILGLIVVVSLDLEVITETSNFIFLVSMIFMSISLIILRKKRPNLIRPWKIPLFPVLPIFLALVSLILISTMLTSSLGLFGIVYGILILVFGGIYYLFQISRRDRIFLILYGAKIGISLLFILVWLVFQIKFQLANPFSVLSGDQYVEAVSRPFLDHFTLILLGLGIISLIFDLIPARNLIARLTRRKSEVVIVSGIVNLSAKAEHRAHIFTWIIALFEFFVGIFFLVLLVLFGFNILLLDSPYFPAGSPFLNVLFETLGLILVIVYIINGGVRLIVEKEYTSMLPEPEVKQVNKSKAD